MNQQRVSVVDFVARQSAGGVWKLVLVEQGPWIGSLTDNLSRVQERLYDCIDIALDGKLAQRFPESKGKPLIVQLDCYDLPRSEVEEFFVEFSSGVLELDDYKKALDHSPFVESIGFEINFESIN
jgi:hypothetical protein